MLRRAARRGVSRPFIYERNREMDNTKQSNITKHREGIRGTVLCGLFAAIIAVLTLVTIPMPSGVPITLQTFAVALCGYSLGCAKGTAATFVYVALGAVGLPVFSGMKGGFSVLVGPTGGYIYGFVGMAALCGLGAYLFLRLTKRKGAVMKALGTAAAVVCGLAGLAVCHVCGTIQFAALTGRTFGEAAMLASVPYLAKDIISVVGAFAVGSVISTRVVNK